MHRTIALFRYTNRKIKFPSVVELVVSEVAYHVMAGIARVLVLELVRQGTVGPGVVASLPARRPPLHHQDGQRREHLPRVPRPMPSHLLDATRPHLPVKENIILVSDTYNQSNTYWYL